MMNNFYRNTAVKVALTKLSSLLPLPRPQPAVHVQALFRM